MMCPPTNNIEVGAPAATPASALFDAGGQIWCRRDHRVPDLVSRRACLQLEGFAFSGRRLLFGWALPTEMALLFRVGIGRTYRNVVRSTR